MDTGSLAVNFSAASAVRRRYESEMHPGQDPKKGNFINGNKNKKKQGRESFTKIRFPKEEV